MRPRPLNYTTQVAAKKTVAECMDLLSEAGAGHVSVSYTKGEPSGLAFSYDGPGGREIYQLPVTIDGIAKLLAEASWPASAVKSGAAKNYRTRQHAVNVAWRVMKDWLVSQLTLIDAQMAGLSQVMLPYLQVEPGVTMYEALTSGRAAITAGNKP